MAHKLWVRKTFLCMRKYRCIAVLMLSTKYFSYAEGKFFLASATFWGNNVLGIGSTVNQVFITHTYEYTRYSFTFCFRNTHLYTQFMSKIVAAFRGMHVSPAKHSYAWLPTKSDYRTDRQTNRQAPDYKNLPWLCTGTGKFTGVSKICSPQRSLRNRGPCKSLTLRWISLSLYKLMVDYFSPTALNPHNKTPLFPFKNYFKKCFLFRKRRQLGLIVASCHYMIYDVTRCSLKRSCLYRRR